MGPLPRSLSCLALASLAACASFPAGDPFPSDVLRAPNCRAERLDAEPAEVIAALDAFTSLFESGCDKEALRLGEWLRRNFHDKDTSVSTEVASVFVPEDLLSPYVLESYERAHVSLMLAALRLRADDRDGAAVDLRRAYQEGKALIYNFGEDLPNLLLAAALWENLGEPDTARPFWRTLFEETPDGDPIHRFAADRLAAIDKGGPESRAHWKIVTAGHFPELEWTIDFGRRGPGSIYQIRAKGFVIPACRSNSAALIGPRDWIDKIQLRYASDYHPLLNLKSWMRFPIGAAYGAVVFSAGAAVMVGGCMPSDHGGMAMCPEAIQLGGALMHSALDLTNYTLRPDTRHWRKMPAAIFVSREDELANDECWKSLPSASRFTTTDWLNKIK